MFNGLILLWAFIELNVSYQRIREIYIFYKNILMHFMQI